MFRNVVVVAASALVASVALAGPAPAAGDDIAAAQAELTAAATVTRAKAAGGYRATGPLPSFGGAEVDAVMDSAGHGRQIVGTEPEDQLSFVATGVGTWFRIPERTREVYAAGLAYIGRPNAVYVFNPDEDLTTENIWLGSGAESVDHLEKSRHTFLSVRKVDDGEGKVTYTFEYYVDTPAQPSTMTAELTDGVVTGFGEFTEIADGDDLSYHRTWVYEPQTVVLPTEAQTTTSKDLAWSRSAVVLRETVKRHARQTATAARSIAKKAKRTKVLVRDVRAAAKQVVEKYSDGLDPRDELPTTAASLTGGVALHATDPYKRKVRIATVQAVKGKVVVST